MRYYILSFIVLILSIFSFILAYSVYSKGEMLLVMQYQKSPILLKPETHGMRFYMAPIIQGLFGIVMLIVSYHFYNTARSRD